MSVADIRREAVHIVNEVLERLGVNTVTNLNDTRLSTLLTRFLNDVIDEVSDYGDWPEMYREAEVTASSSVETYELAVSGNVKNIYEIVFDTERSPLRVVTIEDIRRLQRGRSFGTPRQFAVVGVSGVNPLFRASPIAVTANVTSNTTFKVAYYKKPSIVTAVTANNSAIPAFPSRMLIQGVYAKALLEESGGEPTNEYQVAYTEYLRMRTEALNRLTADTGSDVYLVPT